MKPDAASAARQRTAVVGTMPARCAILVVAIPPRAGIASSTWVVSRSMASRSSAGRNRRLRDDLGWGGSTGLARAELARAALAEAAQAGSLTAGSFVGSRMAPIGDRCSMTSAAVVTRVPCHSLMAECR